MAGLPSPRVPLPSDQGDRFTSVSGTNPLQDKNPSALGANSTIGEGFRLLETTSGGPPLRENIMGVDMAADPDTIIAVKGSLIPLKRVASPPSLAFVLSRCTHRMMFSPDLEGKHLAGGQTLEAGTDQSSAIGTPSSLSSWWP